MDEDDAGILNMQLSDDDVDVAKKKADRTGQAEDDFQATRRRYRVKVENGDVRRNASHLTVRDHGAAHPSTHHPCASRPAHMLTAQCRCTSMYGCLWSPAPARCAPNKSYMPSRSFTFTASTTRPLIWSPELSQTAGAKLLTMIRDVYSTPTGQCA